MLMCLVLARFTVCVFSRVRLGILNLPASVVLSVKALGTPKLCEMILISKGVGTGNPAIFA